MPKAELISLLNEALKMEHAAAVQYRAHAELIAGPMSEPLMSRLRELAGDEDRHAAKLRTLISDFLEDEVSMDMAPTRRAADLNDILLTNIGSERGAVAIYRKVLITIEAEKNDLADQYETLRFEIDAILREEQEHIAELTRLV